MRELICEECGKKCLRRSEQDGKMVCEGCSEHFQIEGVSLEIPESLVWISSPAKQGKHKDGTIKKLFIIPKKLSSFIDENHKYSIVVRKLK